MEQTDDKFLKAKSYNAKLFPIYKMFGWDLLFYYSISFLFLSQGKNLTTSQILFGEAFYPIFKLIFQIPCVNIIELIGKRKSLILGNVSITIAILLLIIMNGLNAVIIFNILIAFGYSIKNLCESPLLNDCVAHKEHARTIFSNLDGKGSAYWYFFDAITASLCGFLFVFNHYLPMILSLVSSIIALIISFKFLPYEDKHDKSSIEETGSFVEYFKNLRTAFKNIFKSNRLKALILFSGLFSGLLMVRSTIASSLFTEIGVKEEYFGVIFAVLTGLSGISSKFQHSYHKKLKNKLLTYFSLSFCISMIVIGLTAIVYKSSIFTFVIVFIAYAIQYMIKGPYYTLQKRYLNSFSSSSMVPKIYSANTLIESIFSTLVYFAASYMLNFISTSFTIVILGCVFTIAFIFVLDYMRTRIGLKPEEYKKSDISFTEIH